MVAQGRGKWESTCAAVGMDEMSGTGICAPLEHRMDGAKGLGEVRHPPSPSKLPPLVYMDGVVLPTTRKECVGQHHCLSCSGVTPSTTLFRHCTPNFISPCNAV